MSHKLFVLIDLEGIIGVTDLQEDNTLLLNKEIDIVLKIAGKYGYKEFVLANIHNRGDWDYRKYQDNSTEVLCGLNELVNYDFNNEDIILIGFHGMSGADGLFPHSFRTEIKGIMLDGKPIGEVGIYSRWFINKGLRVLMVSGEGSFQSELPDGVIRNSVTHQHRLIIQYSNFEQSLVNAFSEKCCCRDSFAGEITVQFKYPLLLNRLEGFLKKEDSLVFSSIEEFLDNLERMALALNDGIKYIVSYNLSFINRIDLPNDLETRKKIKKLDVDNVLEKDILTITPQELDDLYIRIKGQ